MHLVMNGFFWNQKNTGSGQYTRQLVYHLDKLVSDLNITLVYPAVPGDPGPEAVPPGVKVDIVPIRTGQLGKVIFEQITFPRRCRALEATVAHVPYWGPPLQAGMPLVATVHDLTTLLVREYRRGLKARLYNSLVSAGARAATHVITDSKASKKDITVHLGLAGDRVTPIYLAVGSSYRPESELLIDMAVQRKYDLPDNYVLYLGGYEIHKNVTTLLLAYTYVQRGLGEDYPLVLAGKKPASTGAHYPDYEKFIKKLGLEEMVRWTGYVEEADKPAVYRGAAAFVFISRREGFGLPPLEAMACGVPVVAGQGGSLPEVVGDAAFAVDPDDERGIAGAIIAAVLQDELAAELREKGLVQAAKFSWDKTATETLMVYDRASG